MKSIEMKQSVFSTLARYDKRCPPFTFYGDVWKRYVCEYFCEECSLARALCWCPSQTHLAPGWYLCQFVDPGVKGRYSVKRKRIVIKG